LSVGRTRISANHQVTVPKRAFDGAGLAVGDLVRAEAVGDGEVILRRINPTPNTPNGASGGGAARLLP